MSLPNSIFLYRARLNTRIAFAREAFAVAGIAVGVALLFASQVMSTSPSRTIEDPLTPLLVGNAQYQMIARGPSGFTEGLLARVLRVPGVQAASPAIEQPATVVGHNGKRSVELIGIDPRSERFTTAASQRLPEDGRSPQQALALPAPIASAVGARALENVMVYTRAGASAVLLGATLHDADIGSLVHSSLAFAPIAYVQRLTANEGRITRILVRVSPGYAQQAQAGLERLAGAARVNLEPADFDSRLFGLASMPASEGEALLLAVSSLVGFVFAVNAMLMTVYSRRLLVHDLRMRGATRASVLRVLCVEAAILGGLGCVLGLALGDLLSILATHATPAYLSSVFPVGDAPIVTWRAVAFAVATGMTAAILGVLWPLREPLFRTSARHTRGTPSTHRPAACAQWASRKRATLGGGLACVAITATVLVNRPHGVLLGSLAAVAGLALMLPTFFDLLVIAFGRLQRRLLNGAAATLASHELQNPLLRGRSLALALTSGVAVFGCVAVGGTQINLQHGLEASASAIDASASLWVTPKGESAVLVTTPFVDHLQPALERVAGVRSVGVYRGSFLNWGDRRLWVLAPPRDTPLPVPAGQLLQGNPRSAAELIHKGGWAIVSSALAHDHHLRLGEQLILPTPTLVGLRVAAISTNFGWPPGAVILNSSDYARAWGSHDPSAYELQAKPGSSLSKIRDLADGVLASQPNLTVETSGERSQRDDALIRQGLSRVRKITLMLLIASALAIASTLASMIWQRRQHVAFMKVDGYRRGVLWRWLACESALVLTTGCFAGTVFGLYGQLLNNEALANVTGFPVQSGVEVLAVAVSFLAVGATALVMAAVPGYLAVRVPPCTTPPTH